MKDVCIPISNFEEDQIAEVILKVGGKKISYNFRIESFPWMVDDTLSKFEDEVSESLLKIYKLKEAIQKYDKDWELIQIYTPNENAKNIQVLYRKKS
ncbi:hypothetical protein ACFLSI_05720 [Bacteroidota bacterium]